MGLDNIAEVTFSGKYSQGMGKASLVCATPTRQEQFKELFNSGLIGTFNIVLDRDCTKIQPTIHTGIHKYNLIKIIKKNGRFEYGWAYRWKGSSLQNNKIEVYTKHKLDDSFKSVPLTVQFLVRKSDDFINSWQKNLYWFQGFSWLLPENKRADSERIWHYMKGEDYSNKTVLDFGCHYGFYSFKAAKQGAIVNGVDKKTEDVSMATFINDNIELTDAKFEIRNTIPIGKWDFIFELSVFHWINSNYSKLSNHINLLKSKCKVLYIELINPPLEGGLTTDQVDNIVGGEKLLHYQHNIRKTRTIYKVKGDL